MHRPVALGAAIVLAGLLGGAAAALPATSHSGGAGDSTVDLPSLAIIQHAKDVVATDVDNLVSGEVGGTHPGPGTDVPRPEDYVNAAIQTLASTLGNAAQGLGGIHVGPLPGPVPGAHPEDLVNQGIQTVASGLGDAAQGLGGIHVGPLPGPVPGALPISVDVP
jgi:hypothetical protein